ncbi:MAG: hypothetical protein ACO3QC_05115 [Phycisphaerales bacterium]
MKNKGIPFIEQHIEKIVLGVAGAVFFSVVAWQFLGSPNSVKLDGASVAPGDLDAALEGKTSVLSSKLSAPQAPLSTQLADKVKPAEPLYGAAIAKSLSPSSSLPTIEPRLALALQSDGATGGQLFHVPRFAAVAMRETRQLSDSLDAAYVEKDADLKAKFPATGAWIDVTWTVPSAVLDLAQIRSELGSSRDGMQVPGIWHRDSLFIIDVAFEREREMADGSWGSREVVEALPGAFSFRPEIAKGADAGLRDGAFTYLAEKSNQLQIIQPDFLPTKSGNFSAGLMLADDGGGAAGEDPDIRRLRKQLARQNADIQRLEDELKEIGGPLEDTSKEDKKKEEQRQKEEERQNRGGGGSSGGGGGGGGMGRPPGGGLSGGFDGGKRTGGADPRDEATKERRIRMTKGLKDLRKKADATESQLSKKLEAIGAKLDQEKAAAAASSDISKAGSIVVWGHDVGVEPSQTYRYRCVVKTYNPFFTNASLLVPEQKSLADSFTLDTKMSEWSEPVEVSPPVAFFVVDASAGDGRLGVGQATVEVFRYSEGQRHQQSFSVQPGDPIGSRGGATSIDFSTGYYLVDVVPDPTSDRGGVDRRVGAIAIVQSSSGERYEIRVPKAEQGNPARIAFEDEVELAKSAAESAAAEGAAGGKDGGGGAGTPNAPKTGDPKDPNYGPRG